VIPSQDLLAFFAQCLEAVEGDATLAGISSWNDNGEPRQEYNRHVYRDLSLII
jgi:hypothetical protein